MAITAAALIAHPSVRHFSAHRPHPQSRTARTVAMSYLISGSVIPFIPPALESLRQKNSNLPDNSKVHPPLCYHAR